LWVIKFDSKEFPSVVLANFDLTFFDLQAPGDDYADNPEFYLFDGTLSDGPGVAGRYPPR
jgi:hypothetical protein